MTTETSAIAIALYDTREAWLHGFKDAAAPLFEQLGFPLPDNIRISISKPTASKRGVGEAGVCYAPHMSHSGHYEIFLNPILEGESKLAETLTHELIHTVCFADGHGKTFGKLARALGLEGPLTGTFGGADWLAWAAPIIESLGDMPYSSMVNMERKVKPTPGIKIECPECGWLARASSKHITAHSHLNCPNPDCDGELIPYFPATDSN